jgi:MFS family permease
VSGTAFASDLRGVLAERDFRRLFATRLVSQAGDGLFTAGLGSYVFFTKTTFPNPATAAAAFAVLYLPYSLIGPFAGVFIDRWSRRQILVWSALLRAGLVAITASLVVTGRLGLPLYVSALGVLGANRFFLSSLSAALPHVVAEDKLVMANSVATTTGTLVSSVGILASLGVHLLTGSGVSGSTFIMIVTGGCYLLSGSIGATMRRDLLGPPPLAEGEQRPRLSTEFAVVVKGLASGAQHVWQRRQAAAALGATGAQRAIYGILLLTAILLYRNYFYRTSAANSSLAHFTLVVAAGAAGFGTAAVVTPVLTRWLTKAACITTLLTAGGVVTGLLGPLFLQPAFLVISFALGVVAQGVTICATTILQQQMEDSYRGRVFALYDMLFNLPFVMGAAAAAQVIPGDGKSYPLMTIAAAGYLTAALAYAGVSRHELRPEPAPPVPAPSSPVPGEAEDPEGASPSPSPHRSSS